MATTIESIQQLYIAYFNRPADLGGLNYWADRVANGTSLSAISAEFSTQAEFTAEYGGKSPEATVAQVYQNLLNRTPDATGLAFWATGLRNGVYTTKSIVEEIAKSALQNQNPEGNVDRATVDNKIDAAIAFTDYLKTDVNAQIAYSTGSANGVAKAFIAGVTDTASLTAAIAALSTVANNVVGAGNPGVNTALTAGVDTLNGGAGNDVFTGVVHATDGTLTDLDAINGGAGNDTLNLNLLDATTLPAVSVTAVENVVVRGALAVDVDSSGWTGVTSLKVTQGAAVTAVAAGTTAIDVSGATGAIEIDGGSTVAVVAGTADQDVKIGDATAAKGAVTVTHSKLDDGGTIEVTTKGAATVTASGLKTGGAADQTTVDAAGAVAVTTTGVAYDPAAATTLGGVKVTGGTTIAVTQHASSDASGANDEDANVTNIAHEVTLGAVAITGGAATTEVTVMQEAVAAENGVAAVAAKAGSQTITFTAAAANDVITVGGLSFTAAKALTAAQVAAAFAGLKAGTQFGSAPVGNGVYSGTFSAEFTTGAVTTAAGVTTVVAASDDSTATLLAADGVIATAGALTAAVDEVEAEEGVMGVKAGAVTIDGTASKIAKVTLDSYGTSSITSDFLTTLSLANSASVLTINNTKATALALTLDGLATGAGIVGGAAYKTLNITAVDADSKVDADFASVEALTVGGSKAVSLVAGSTLTGLKTVVVSGSAGLTIADALANGVTSVNASATSGAVSVSINNAGTTFAGGSGADTLSFTSNVTTKGATMGAGDDKVVLFAGTTSLSGVVNGGDGTDTLQMDAADAAAASLSTTFETKIDSFEKLSLTGTASETIDLQNLDDIKYVITSGATALVLDNMATGGTIEHTAAATLVTANILDADDNAADVLNVVLKTNANATVAAGEIVAADVESINVTATDTKASDGITDYTLTLTGDALTTVKVTGNAALNLTLGTGTDAVTSIDGSAMTAALTAGTVAGGSEGTIKGGEGKDVLTANGTDDKLIGGAGADRLILNGDQAVMTGGAGADTFVVSHVTTNVNSYASITDLAAGDMIEFHAADSFLAAKVTSTGTAVFQNLADKAVATTDAGQLAWFQFGGNTYIVENVSDNATSFDEAQDRIVQIVGNVDLSKSSLSETNHTLLFA